ALIADLVIEDSYSKAMNWLGLLEERIPNCRVAQCTIRNGESSNNINMAISVQIPIYDGGKE
ncbi:MAG: hypothetical protein AAF226_18485, partial [Verrucomicrobiota bacterium]